MIVEVPFSVKVSTDGERATVQPVGRLDVRHRNVVFCRCLAPGQVHVLVDASRLTYLDAEGLAAIFAARSVLESEGGSLTIAHATGQPAVLLADPWSIVDR